MISISKFPVNFILVRLVFECKYLGQNMVDFNIFGVFWNPQDKQNMNVSLDLYFDEELKEKIRSLEGVLSAACRHCMSFWMMVRLNFEDCTFSFIPSSQ